MHGFDVEKVAQLYGAAEIVTLRSGNLLFRAGDEGDALYIVKSGTVRIVNGSIVYEPVGDGGIVGEMALVDKGMRRSASAIAATSAELIQDRRPEIPGAGCKCAGFRADGHGRAGTPHSES